MGLLDMLNNNKNSKEEKPKEYVKEVENINSYTEPKTAEERNKIIKDYIKTVVKKNE